MMGRLKSDQESTVLLVCLGDAVPEDHLVRKIDTASRSVSRFVARLAPHYSAMGRLIDRSRN